MPISEILSLVGVLLLLCFVGIVIFSRRETATSKRFQEIASYKFKAEEAQDLHDSLAKLGLDKTIYKILLQRVVDNYAMAYAIDAESTGLEQRLLAAKELVDGFDKIEYYSELPSTPIELQGLISKMGKLVKYLNTLQEKRALPDGLFHEVMPSLQENLLRLNVEGDLKIGHQAMQAGQLGTARQCYSQAKATLLEFDSNASYVQEHLKHIDALLVDLTEREANLLHQTDANKQDSLTAGEQTPEIDSSLTDEEQQMQDAALSQTEYNRLNEATGGHEVKKKW